MKFTYDGITYYIQFRHTNPLKSKYMSLNGRPTPIRYTKCKILTWEGRQVLSFGSHDFEDMVPYCKEVGRKAALREALLGQPRTFRSLAWLAYFNRGMDFRTHKTVGEGV